jgi:hypothetical protein
VVPTEVTFRAFSGFDPLFSGHRLVQDMTEPILEAPAHPIEIGMLAFFLPETFLGLTE